jgi:hypothetical protein
LLFIGLVGLLFKHIHVKAYAEANAASVASATPATGTVTTSTTASWPETFANYIRHNDVALMESCAKVLKEFEEELMVCEDWMEIFDVLSKLLILQECYLMDKTN